VISLDVLSGAEPIARTTALSFILFALFAGS
jgi:hypothetical protein